MLCLRSQGLGPATHSMASAWGDYDIHWCLEKVVLDFFFSIVLILALLEEPVTTTESDSAPAIPDENQYFPITRERQFELSLHYC